MRERWFILKDRDATQTRDVRWIEVPETIEQRQRHLVALTKIGGLLETLEALWTLLVFLQWSLKTQTKWSYLYEYRLCLYQHATFLSTKIWW